MTLTKGERSSQGAPGHHSCRHRDPALGRTRATQARSRRETLTLNAFLRHSLARVALSDITSGMVTRTALNDCDV
jgi:hypothetical protein